MSPSHGPSSMVGWDYELWEGYQPVLLDVQAEFLQNLRAGRLQARELAEDTRPLHREFFESLSWAGSPFAGGYRGGAHRLLRRYEVGVQQDPSVGIPAFQVASEMARLGREIRLAFDQADQVRSAGGPLLAFVLNFAAVVFERFLRIHPYANGNGHMARLLVWLILGEFGFWPERWTIEPRPYRNQGYTQAIIACRHRGDPRRLMAIFADALRP